MLDVLMGKLRKNAAGRGALFATRKAVESVSKEWNLLVGMEEVECPRTRHRYDFRNRLTKDASHSVGDTFGRAIYLPTVDMVGTVRWRVTVYSAGRVRDRTGR